MGDMLDQAAEYERIDREQAMKRRKEEGPAATGFCLYCEEPLSFNGRWCDSGCRDDYEAEQKARG